VRGRSPLRPVRSLIAAAFRWRLVHGHLVYDEPEVWDQRSGLAAVVGPGQLPDRLDHVAQIALAMVRPAREKLSGRSRWMKPTSAASPRASRGAARNGNSLSPSPLSCLIQKDLGRVRLRRVEDVSSASLVPLLSTRSSRGQRFAPTAGMATRDWPNRTIITVRSTCRQRAIRRTSSCRAFTPWHPC